MFWTGELVCLFFPQKHWCVFEELFPPKLRSISRSIFQSQEGCPERVLFLILSERLGDIAGVFFPLL